ncbi:acyl-CoA reductase [Polluticoccus soli]|uniref:acyl-CoA reductase n=1 Tax=Polluticoccus soli TaxID=3034150 RepID=UPI0023E25523|nr:acyl-CoA reductase [Flavipsychrobacter sp. JY13-12]
MISLAQRIDLLVKLGNYLLSDDEQWEAAQYRATTMNAWFTLDHIEMAATNIVKNFLQRDKLTDWIKSYDLPQTPKTVGIVMAGNIPMVGFHDFLCGFVSGHKLLIKLSSKDEVLMAHIVRKLTEWEPKVAEQVHIAEQLKNCDAYIATGSNNTARYFEQYFAKYPNIIRKNRTSVAILDGTETEEELHLLGGDIFNYFGLGCRNVTQVCVPRDYDLTKLMDSFQPFEKLIEHNKYKNNFDYYLAIYLLNKVHHYTNNSVLLVENASPFSAVSVVHYRRYDDKQQLTNEMSQSDDIQCIVGHGFIPFGNAQCPALNDYADGVDTMAFLCSL